MDFVRASRLLNSIDVLEAQDMLRSLKVMDWPKMKAEDRRALHKTLYKQAYPSGISNSGPLKMEDAAKILGEFQKQTGRK